MTHSPAPAPSKALLWTGRILSAIPVLMMGVMALCILILNPSLATGDMVNRYHFPSEAGIPILIIEIVCALIYAIPQTAALGAILLTGYLGGAVATHVNAAEYPRALLPFLFGILVWLGLFLRDARLRALLPIRRSSKP